MKAKELYKLIDDLQEELNEEVLSVNLTLDENDTEVFIVWTTEEGGKYKTDTVPIVGLSAEQIRDAIRNVCRR